MSSHSESDLQKIPGVGVNMEAHLVRLGYPNIRSLCQQDPEEMYQRDVKLHGGNLDRCVLYCYRLAVYFAQTPPENQDPEKLKWWNWKD